MGEIDFLKKIFGLPIQLVVDVSSIQNFTPTKSVEYLLINSGPFYVFQ